MRTAGIVALILCPLFALATLIVFAAESSMSALAAIFGILSIISLLTGLLLNGDYFRSLSGRTVKYGTSTAIGVIVVLALVVMIEFLSVRYNERFDLTENQRYSLAPQTMQILENLPRPVEVLAFFQQADPAKVQLEQRLELYDQASDDFTYRFVNLDTEPMVAQQYEIQEYGTILFMSGDRQEQITVSEERDLTNAIVKVTREGRKKVYVVQGHGELSLDRPGQNGAQRLKQDLEAENYEVATLDLGRVEAVPEDADSIAILNPESEFFDPEIAVLREYLDTGGRVFIGVNPLKASSLGDFAEDYGVIVGENFVLDFNPISQMMGGNPQAPLISDFTAHDITRALMRGRVVLPTVSSVTKADTPPTGKVVTVLAKSSPDCWAETNIDLMMSEGAVELNEGEDIRGPVGVAAAVEFDGRIPTGGGDSTKARLVVVGDGDFVNDGNFGMANNADLFLNSMAWLMEAEDTISIRPKDVDRTAVMLAASQRNLLTILPIIVNPMIPFLGGVFVFFYRRRS